MASLRMATSLSSGFRLNIIKQNLAVRHRKGLRRHRQLIFMCLRLSDKLLESGEDDQGIRGKLERSSSAVEHT